MGELSLIHIFRYFIMIIITTVITLVVIDFQSVVDAFAAIVEAVEMVLGPLKSLL